MYVIASTINVLSIGDSALFACILWSIWKQHNNKVWNDIKDARCFVLERASNRLYEWEATHKARTNHGSEGKPSRPFKWVKPIAGRMKCNIDTCAFVLAKTKWFQPTCYMHIGKAIRLILTPQWVQKIY
ncbi:transmembrane protein, putative [Medicago truncatula]|uniref:Transmembrane protein, putative n=1 Tax=Medicago truncatula TaxID=3880 RepID=G7JBZ3_MEDTR|nr:transmembrane protein, putative [Medicago truncatula]